MTDQSYRRELVSRALDSAVKAMGRGRALLLVLNLLSALVLTTVYLERESIDEKQRTSHIIALQDIQKKLIESGVPDTVATTLDPVRIEKWILTRSDVDLAERLKQSAQLYRARLLQNDLRAARLPDDVALPIGVSLPRNDLVPIVSILMVLLYSWFLFSFQQLTEIVGRMRDYIPAAVRPSSDSGCDNSDMDLGSFLREALELHFLFRTSRGGPTKWLVQALYYSPPIVLALATANDFYSIYFGRTGEWSTVLKELAMSRLLLQAVCLTVLTMIGYHVHKADKHANIQSLMPKNERG